MGIDQIQHRRTTQVFNAFIHQTVPPKIPQGTENLSRAFNDIKNLTEAFTPHSNIPTYDPLPRLKTDTWKKILLTGLYASKINHTPLLANFPVTDSAQAVSLLSPRAEEWHPPVGVFSPYPASPPKREKRENVLETFEFLSARADAVHACGGRYQDWINEMREPIPQTSDENTHCDSVFNTIRIAIQEQNLQLNNIDSTMCMANCPATIRVLLSDIDVYRAKLVALDNMIAQLNDSLITYDDRKIRKKMLAKRIVLNAAIEQFQTLINRCTVMANKAGIIQSKLQQVSNNIVFHCDDLLGGRFRLPDFDINASDPSYYLLLDNINKARELKGKIDVLEVQIRNQLSILARRPTIS